MPRSFRLRSMTTSGVHPIHGVWSLVGLASVLAARFYLPLMPTKLLVCPSRTLFDIRCVGCGSATALVALAHFRIWDAIVANPLLVIGGVTLSVWGLIAAVAYFIGRPLPKWATTKRRKNIQRYVLIALVIGNWAYELFVRG